MVNRSPQFDQGFQDELERLGVLPPRRPVQPMPTAPAVRPIAPGRGTNLRVSSVARPIVDQSRPGSPPPATPPATATPVPAPQPAPRPTATPIATDTPIAGPPAPFIQPMTPHTRAASQTGAAVPEGSTEAAATPEGYRQVRTPDGSLWVVDGQGRLARPGSLNRPTPLGNTTSQQSVEATLTTPDARVTEAATSIRAADAIAQRPRATYRSDAAYDDAQRAAREQRDRAQATIDTQGAQTTVVTDIATARQEAQASTQAATDYRAAPIESGPYQGQTLDQVQDSLILPSLNDRQWQTAMTNPAQYGVDPATGIDMAAALGLPAIVPPNAGFTQEQWTRIIASAPPMSPDMAGSYTQEQWVYAIFQSRVLNEQGVQLSDDDGNAVTRFLEQGPAVLDWARGQNVNGMGENVYSQITTGEGRGVSGVVEQVLPGTNPFNTWALDPANQPAVLEAYRNGYTGADGQTYSGGRGVWELYASQADRGTRIWQDLLLDPANFLAVLTGGGNLAVRTGTRLVERGGASVFPGRVIQAGGQVARAPGLVVDVVPDRILGGTASVLGGAISETPVGDLVNYLRRVTPEGQALQQGRTSAQAGARVYDAQGRLTSPPGRPGIDEGGDATAGVGPTVTPPVLPGGNRVRFVTPTTPDGQAPTRPGTGIVADVGTTSRPRHIVFRNADGTDTVVPVGQGPIADVGTTTRPRHIVVRTSDGQRTVVPLPDATTTNRPIHVVIRHEDGTETVIPPEMVVAPNADVTARPRPMPLNVPPGAAPVAPTRAPDPSAIPPPLRAHWPSSRSG